jgi:hypothetical protein
MENNNSEHNIGPFGYLPFGEGWGGAPFLLHIRRFCRIETYALVKEYLKIILGS